MAIDRVAEELEFRQHAWQLLRERGGPHDVTRGLIRELKLYGGAQGVWVDAERTRGVAPGGGTVTVGLLHTGRHYADDLSPTGIVYHYPRTNRGRQRDASEIEATKRASELTMPVFVVTPSDKSAQRRDVHLGWVVDWDDEDELFLVTFTDNVPATPDPSLGNDFALFDQNDERRRREVAARPNQQRFRFDVLSRYGAICAVCDIDAREVLDTIHLAEKADRGADRAENGLVLCATHHRALDRGLFCIEPTTYAVHVRADVGDLRLTRSSVAHLKAHPHAEALEWRWKRWTHRPTESESTGGDS